VVLLKLGRLTVDQQFMERARQTLEAFSGQLAQSPASLTAMLTAIDFWFGPAQEIVIAGDLEDADTKEMLKLVHRRFLPRVVVLFHGTGEAGKAIEREVAFLRGQVAISGKSTAYVCENYACKKPVNSVGELEGMLIKISEARKGNN
jgi:uncharacterized protein YyaL (SSP411 family)